MLLNLYTVTKYVKKRKEQRKRVSTLKKEQKKKSPKKITLALKRAVA
jgi:hypothetical protein